MKVAEQPASTADELQSDPRWQLVQRVVSSSAFARSARLSSFLMFVSQRAIQGRTDNLNEQEIGVKVFGRTEGYLQSDDNIVRANASRLRQRLEEYFASEGQFETLRVSLPKGGYIPEFATVSLQSRIPQEPVTEAAVETNPTSSTAVVTQDYVEDTSSLFVWKSIALSALILLVLVLGVAIRFRKSHDPAGAKPDFSGTPSSRFWAALFDGSNPTLVVPADSSLVMYRSMTHHTVSLGQYINGEYRVKPDDGTDDLTTAKGIARRRLTSIADLKFVAGVVPKLQGTDRRMDVRYARDLQTQDFRQSNIILLGARYANPWVSLVDSERQYSLLFDEKTRIYDLQDRSRNTADLDLIKFHPGEPEDRAYALIAFVPNSTAGRHVLVLEGTSIAGTEAAVNLILDTSALDEILSKHMLANGAVPNFELVLESKDFSGSSSSAKVIASRFW